MWCCTSSGLGSRPLPDFRSGSEKTHRSAAHAGGGPALVLPTGYGWSSVGPVAAFPALACAAPCTPSSGDHDVTRLYKERTRVRVREGWTISFVRRPAG